ncbi:hypothetical protein QAD02_021914 [Eretmocerus hayati]|uniref:Uncharacterized protein n=1 Tax=Eretmocerus hayati TaxID=131215 RepID=A0ACC2PRT8_9HYME|nr:hypothetical protein QAD02_021914 [Eretmocerus hayati]
MAAPTEQRQRYLIGGPISPIDDRDQIPLNGQVLKSLLYHIQNDQKKLRCAAKSASDKVLEIWKRNGIPTRKKYHCQNKIIKLYNEYRNILKHKNRPSSKVHEKEFCENVELVFDIAHSSWQQDVDIEIVAPLTD